MRKFLTWSNGVSEMDAWQPGCWVSVEDPDGEDVSFMVEKLGVPEAFLSDIHDGDERPRIEEEDGWILVILRIPCCNTSNDLIYTTIPMGIVLKDNCFVTVCHFQNDMLSDFMRYTVRKKIEIDGNWNLLLRLFLSSSVWYSKYLKQITYQSRQIEQELEHSIQNEDLQRLLKVEKSLVFFITSMRGNDSLLMRLKGLRSYRKYFDDDLLEDVEIELHQALDTARIHDAVLNGTMDLYASVISNNLNVVMKRMTSISLLLMVPTLIASVYGMNVNNGLEHSQYGFVMVCGISVLLTGLAFIGLRIRKWF